MKQMLCGLALLALAAQLPLWGYDQSPSYWQIVPEAIWAAATGGGTWVTEIQVTSFAPSVEIWVWFYYNGGFRGPFTLTYGLTQYHSLRYGNFLATLDSLDYGAFTYYSRAGAVWFSASDYVSPIAVQAKTVNGNFGKTFPGLNVVAGHSAAQGRPMMIHDIVQNTTYRTSVGIFSSHYVNSYTLGFTIVDSNNNTVGTSFNKTLGPYGFLSFNPFAEAGVPSGSYSNCWLAISVIAGGSDVRGVFCYGSVANNFTNDTYALIARPRT